MNASTMCSQLVDTSVILLILCSVKVIPWGSFYSLLWMGWMFKVFVALIDTPIIYFCLWLLKDKYFLQVIWRKINVEDR